MLTLSIRQPWAWLIIRPDITDPAERIEAFEKQRMKDIENRSWATPYRGDFLLHASKQIDGGIRNYPAFRQDMLDEHGILMPSADQLQLGGIVGMANLYGCVTESDSLWFLGDFGFQLRRARPLPFLPCPGRLGFFETDYRLPT